MFDLFETAHLDSLGVTRVGDITDLDLIGIPVWFACRPNSRGLSQTQGKGLTAVAARTSAVMEAAEHYFAENADQYLHTESGTLASFSGDLIPLDGISMCDTRQLDPDRQRLFCQGQSLFSDRAYLAPYELVGLDFRVNGPWDRKAFRTSTVGLGAGRSREAAVTHALLEVVENSATVLLDALGPLAPLVKRVGYDEGLDRGLDLALSKVRTAGLLTCFVSIPCRMGIPVIGAYVFPPSTSSRSASNRGFAGYACRPRATDAALAALLEAVQSRLTEVSGVRDDIDPALYQSSGKAPTMRSEQDNASDVIHAGSMFPGDPKDELSAILAHLASHQVVDAYVFDLAPPDAGYAVVRVIIPNLDHASDGDSMGLGMDGISALLAIAEARK